MPYQLADEWFNAMLNSVSLSFQRQAMKKSKEARKGKGGKGGRAQESEASMVTRSAGKSAATGDSEESSLQGGDASTTPVGSSTRPQDDVIPLEGEEADLDIPTFLLTVQQRLRRKHKPEVVKKSMPTHHPLWTTANICQYVQALELQFTSEHYRACGVEPPLATLPPSVTAARVTSPEEDATSPGLDYDATTNTVLVGASAKPSTSTPAGGATAPAFTPATQLNFGMDSEGRWCMMDASGKVVQHFMPSMMTPAVNAPLGTAMSTSSPVGDVSMTTRSETPVKTHSMTISHELTPTLSGVAEMHGAVFARPTPTEKLRTKRPTVPTHPKPPCDITLPRIHPKGLNYLTQEQALHGEAWRLVWRDAERFEQLGDRDAQVLVETNGCNHHFAVSNKEGFTISGACGHISKGTDFHWLYRQCQYLTTRKMCCTRRGNICTL